MSISCKNILQNEDKIKIFSDSLKKHNPTPALTKKTTVIKENCRSSLILAKVINKILASRL
jgi:hypothetical protein